MESSCSAMIGLGSDPLVALALVGAALILVLWRRGPLARHKLR